MDERGELSALDTLGAGFRFDLRVLASYGGCPQRHGYLHVYGIPDRRDRGFARFHGVLHATLAFVAETREQTGYPPTLAEVEAFLSDRWAEAGPTRSSYEPVYRARAGQVAQRFLERVGKLPAGSRLVMRPSFEVRIAGGVVVVTADEAEYHGAVDGTDGGVPTAIRFYKFGRRSDEHDRDDRILLLRAEGYETLCLWYPLADPELRDVLAVPPPRAGVIERRVRKASEQADGLLRGDYAPIPRERECRRCGYKFNCTPTSGCLDD